MKFMHIADLHLDRPFEGIQHISSFLQEKFQENSAQVLDHILQTAIEENIDFLLIVGDTFHQAHISYEMQELWVHFLQQLIDEGIQPCVVFGNHDYYDPARYWLTWPEEVIYWDSEEVETKYIESATGELIAISAFSYCHAHIKEEKATQFPWRDEEVDYHLGLYHGQQGQNEYAPFQLETLKSRGYDYWALGHIHRYQLLSERIAYSGTIQGKLRKEWNLGRAIIGELNAGRCDIRPVLLSPLYYQKIEITITSQTITELIQEMHQQCLYQGDTVVDVELIFTEESDEAVKEELESADFRHYLYQGLATGEHLFVISLRYRYPSSSFHFLDEKLKEEIAQHYQEEELFSAVGEIIFQDESLAPYTKMLMQNRHSVIEEALDSLEEDLKEIQDEN